MKKVSKKFLTLYGFLTLLIIPLISNPNLIDGISYFKTAIAIFLISPIVPYYFYQIYVRSENKNILLFPIIWLVVILTPYFFGSQTYRNIFGAPSRNNGCLSILAFSYYFLFGIFLKKREQIQILAKWLYCISLVASILIITFSLFNVQTDSSFSALNLNRADFTDNIDLFSLVLCFGVIAGTYLWKQTLNRYYLVILLPILFISIWKNLIQVPLILVIAWLSTACIGKTKTKLYLKFASMGVLLSYLIIVFILSYTKIDIGSSPNERLDILEFASSLHSNFTILPSNIDGLSDFSSDFPGDRILDDFHNVYLQYSFSFGLLVGFFFLILTIWPLLRLKMNKLESLLIIPLNFAIIVGLLLGIASPNYLFLVALILGFGVSEKPQEKKPRLDRPTFRVKVLSFFAIPIIAVPVFIQFTDLTNRVEISNSTKLRNVQTQIFLDHPNALLVKTLNLQDSGYKYVVATNFYNVGSCAQGDLILISMKRLNVREIRLAAMESASLECRNLPNK